MNFPRLFGVHVDLKQEIRIWGPVYLFDAIVLIIAFMVNVACNKFFWDCESKIPHLLFSLSIFALGFYSIGRPRTNPGKRNIELFMLTFTPSDRFFQSVNINNYVQMSDLFDTGKNGAHRLMVTPTDIKGV